MRIIIIVFIAAILSFSVSDTEGFASDGAFWAEINFVQKSIEDGFYDIAETRLVELLLADIPSEAEAQVHLLLGKIYYDTGQISKAIAEFSMVEDRFKNTGLEATAVFWRAESYYKEGQYERALEAYQKVILSHSSGEIAEHAYYSIAWCYEKMGEYFAAAGAFRDFIKNYPDKDLTVLAGHALGDVLFKDGRYSEAAVELESHIARYPVNTRVFESYYLLGECYQGQGDIDRAIVNFQRATMTIGSQHWKSAAEYKLGEINNAQGNHLEALKWFRMVADEASIPEFSSSALMAIAAIEDNTGSTDSAVKAYLRIIRKVPENEKTKEAYFYLGEIYRKTGDFENAAAIYREALLRYPKGTIANRTRYALGKAYFGQGKHDRAIVEFYSVAKNPEDRDLVVRSLMSVADILRERKDLTAAADVYDQVLTEYSDSSMADCAQYEIGAIMAEMGRNNAAILAFQSMIINFPASPYLDKVYYRLGVLYAKRGDSYSALENFKKVTDMFPESPLAAESNVQKANTYYDMGRYEDALASCGIIGGELESGDIGYDDSYRRISEYCSGWTNYRLGRVDEAYSIFSHMSQEKGEDELTPGVIFWFGEYFYGKGDFAQAREHFSRVKEDFPESNFAYDSEYWMAWAMYDDNMIEESLKQFLTVSTSSAGDKWSPKATLTLGDILKKQGDAEGAIRHYETVATVYKGSGIANIANNRIGIILKSGEQYVLAMEYFRRALTRENTQTNAQIQFDLAECYEKEGDNLRALEEYLNVEYRYPAGEFWVMRSRLKCAELFEAGGDMEKARKMYEKLARGFGRDAEYAKQKMEQLKDYVR